MDKPLDDDDDDDEDKDGAVTTYMSTQLNSDLRLHKKFQIKFAHLALITQWRQSN
jgi:hypothetical protein